MTLSTAEILREASPYVQRHQNSLFVVYLDSTALLPQHRRALQAMMADVALLRCFNIKLVVVFGMRDIIEQKWRAKKISSKFGAQDNWRVTTAQQLKEIKRLVKREQTEIVELLQASAIEYGIDQNQFDVLTEQRLVYAKPYGIHNGIDYRFTGIVQKIDNRKITNQLKLGNLLLISPLAPCKTTGQYYNLRAIEVALSIAANLKADKFIVLGRPLPKLGSRDFFHAEEFYQAMADSKVDANTNLLNHIVKESIDHRIGRIHFVDNNLGSSLLVELFSRRGSGLLISCDPYEVFRQARVSDIAAIIKLFEPALNQDEILARTPEEIRKNIHNYYLILCDEAIIGVGGLSPATDQKDSGEIHSLVIKPNYRGDGRGQRLVQSLLAKARHRGYRQAYAFTTRAMSFFTQLGMSPISRSHLPKSLRRNPKRGSKIYRLEL